MGSGPSATRPENMWTTLWTIAIAGWASAIRRAISASVAGSFWPGRSRVARAIVSRATRARRDALLVRSPAIPSIASSTTGPNMLQPLVVRRETADAHPDAPLQEIPREPLRGATTHVVQLPEDAVFARGGEAVLDHPVPGRIEGHHRLDGRLRFRVRTVVTEQQGPRLQGKEMAERLEVLLQVERRSGRDRHEDFVAGKVEAGGIACVDASIPFIQDRQLMGRMTGGSMSQGWRPTVFTASRIFDASQDVPVSMIAFCSSSIR